MVSFRHALDLKYSKILHETLKSVANFCRLYVFVAKSAGVHV